VLKSLIFVAALLPAGAAVAKDQKPVSIYVGPMVRDGFVDVDQDVLDSIRDITGELRRSPSFAVVIDESAAALTLRVVSRLKVVSGAGVTTGSGTAIGSQVVGTSVTVPVEVMRLQTLLRVGSYERAFTGESETAWKRCAGSIVKDLAVWVSANRERIR